MELTRKYSSELGERVWCLIYARERKKRPRGRLQLMVCSKPKEKLLPYKYNSTVLQIHSIYAEVN